jgi:hypothetical protein
VLLAVAAVYTPNLGGYFHGDDFVSFVDIATMSFGEHLVSAFSFGDSDFYWRPLAKLYYSAIYQVFGLDAFMFRLANLTIFLVTLALLHRFCLTLGLPRPVAFAAVLIFGLFPNHVVSVAWITNAGRLLATMFFLLSLLALHRAVCLRSWRWEGLAFGVFVLACLSDEVALALAPAVVAYALFVHHDYRRPLRFTARTLVYSALVAVLLPLQFMFTLDDEPRLTQYGLSWQVLEQTWALASQLSLPITPSNPMDVPMYLIPDAQWAAGIVTLVAAAVLFVFGRPVMRFLIVWMIVALAPFVLWNMGVVAPRYVYMAAAPFSVIVASLAYSAVMLVRPWPLKTASAGIATAALLVVAVFGTINTLDRGADWDRATQRYESLATGLKETYEDIPPGSRVIIHHGVWNEFWLWPVVVVQTVYEDTSIGVISVPTSQVGADWLKIQPGDIVVEYDGRNFSRSQLGRWRPGLDTRGLPAVE